MVLPCHLLFVAILWEFTLKFHEVGEGVSFNLLFFPIFSVQRYTVLFARRIKKTDYSWDEKEIMCVRDSLSIHKMYLGLCGGVGVWEVTAVFQGTVLLL